MFPAGLVAELAAQGTPPPPTHGGVGRSPHTQHMGHTHRGPALRVWPFLCKTTSIRLLRVFGHRKDREKPAFRSGIIYHMLVSAF